MGRTITEKSVPQHVAIIMDGNGRWAKKQGFLTRLKGHESGVSALKEIATAAAESGVKYLTVYAFSTENWNRPKAEVNGLMRLLVSSLEKEIDTLQNNKIQLNTIGKMETLPGDCQRGLQSVMEQTAQNDRMMLTLALSYSSKEEILSATKEIATKVAAGEMKVEDIDEKSFTSHLYTHNLPDPDLLIRTSGEYRISNYLLWQIAYAELYFSDKLWPEFTKEEFNLALASYQNRERRFGKTSEQIK
jgi:undecaprenyl diphosphate synthase